MEEFIIPYDELFQMLTTHFCSALSEIVQRYCLFRQQGPSLEAFIVELRVGAECCNIEASFEEMIRARLVCGISNEQIQHRLLSENKLTLTKALELSQSMELAKKSTEVFCLQPRAKLKWELIEEKSKQGICIVPAVAKGVMLKRSIISRTVCVTLMVPQITCRRCVQSKDDGDTINCS